MPRLRCERPAATGHLADEKLMIAGFSSDQSTVGRKSLLVQREGKPGFRSSLEIAYSRLLQHPVFHRRIEGHALSTIHRRLILVPERPRRDLPRCTTRDRNPAKRLGRSYLIEVQRVAIPTPL